MKDIERRYYLDMMNQWLILKHEGKSLGKWLYEHGYRKIAIYGMGVYGRHLVRELNGSEISILYGIDQKEMNSYMGIEVVQPKRTLPNVDLVVNTVICCKDAVYDTLRSISEFPMMGLDDLVFEAYEQ